MAQEDPDNFVALLNVVERRVQQLLPPTNARPILDFLVEIRHGCLAVKKSRSTWRSTDHLQKRCRPSRPRASGFVGVEHLQHTTTPRMAAQPRTARPILGHQRNASGFG